MKNIYSILLFGLHVGFLGEIRPNIRGITFDYGDDGTVYLYGYLDNEPTDEDYGIFSYALTELYSVSPELDANGQYKEKIILTKYNGKNIKKQSHYMDWFYIRYEDD